MLRHSASEPHTRHAVDGDDEIALTRLPPGAAQEWRPAAICPAHW